MSKWSGRTKGFVLGYQIFIFFIKKIGVSASYFLLNFVVPFYFIFLSKARKNLSLTFKKIPGFNKSIYRIIYQNFLNLGKVIIDNFAILTEHKDRYYYDQDGEGYLIDLINQSQSAILISGHLGSWNIAGELLKKKDGVVNVVMYDGEAEKIKRLVDKNIGKYNFKMICINDDLSHLIKIKLAIDNGELICILADRYLESSKTISVKFFDREIDLPLGPFIIASKFNIPYSFIFATKESKFGYKFTATRPKTEKDPQIIANEFSKELSGKLSEYPDQWFNYFNIFGNTK